MTVLAGIFSRSKDYPIGDTACEKMKCLLSRYPDDEVISYKDDRCFLAKIDINAYGQPAFHVGGTGSVSMLAGEPLIALEADNPDQSRKDDLELLHETWDREDWTLLTKARGVFCAVYYQPKPGILSLIADKLGIRSLYFWESKKYIIFATALRILEAFSEVPKLMDLRAVTEIATLNFPLGIRTPYNNVSLLRAAEIVQISQREVSRRQYWRWDEIPPSDKSESRILKEAYDRFCSAVDRRLRNDKNTFGMLSGGLDSRCVMAVLRSRDVEVHSFNFSAPGTQDQVFAREFGRKVGTFHEEIKVDPDMSTPHEWITSLVAARDASRLLNNWPVERPLLMWDGNGGSVGVGHVYLTKTLVDLLRARKCDAAISLYLNQEGGHVLKKLVKSRTYTLTSEIPKVGITEELDDIRCDDPARAFHLFLMLNDQRRHLSEYFENIDLYRMEVLSPFYDSDFLQLILSIPVDMCLGHSFYTKWLKYFPAVVTSVPWQTYPGHEPCPLPIPEGFSYQWDNSFSGYWNNSIKARLLQDAHKMLRAIDFPHQIMSRWRLRLAAWLYLTGLRDYSYVIKTANIYCRYSIICGGKYILPERYIKRASEQL